MATGKLDESALLAQLADERGILRTMYEYCHSLDYSQGDRYADCFEPDGVFEKRLQGTVSEGRHQGRQVLRSRIESTWAAAAAQGPNKPFEKHVILAPIITVRGKEATAEAYWALLSSEPKDSGPSVRAFGRYKDRWAKGTDGKWRIKERIAEVEARSGGRLPQAMKALGA